MNSRATAIATRHNGTEGLRISTRWLPLSVDKGKCGRGDGGWATTSVSSTPSAKPLESGFILGIGVDVNAAPFHRRYELDRLDE